MGALDKFKRDISKHRGRAVMLGILFVTMVAMSVRAVVELRPREVAASPALPPGFIPEPAKDPALEVDGAEAQTRINLSKTLWGVLRHVNADAPSPQATFAFDPAQYPAPAPIVDTSIAPPPGPVAAPTKPLPTPAIDDQTSRISRIHNEARGLIIKSISAGNDTTQPMAIVNQQLVTVGQTVMGFEVTAIRSREVVFVKEGMTEVVKMADGQ